MLAESRPHVIIEGNHYFPPESLAAEHFVDTRRRSICPWKGVASYYTIEVAGNRNEGGAWTYRNPTPLARRIKDHVAFWQGVEVISTDGDWPVKAREAGDEPRGRRG